MHSRLFTISLLTVFLFFGASAYGMQEYRVGAGDLLSVTVFDEPDLSLKQIRVATDGSISFPLLGQVTISGLSASEVEQKLTSLLLDGYLRKPRVTISILEYRIFYVSGQVKNQGGYNYVQGLTVQKAIALAGGLTVRGSDKKIKLVRENKPDVAESADMNTPVGPGDIITVGESFF